MSDLPKISPVVSQIVHPLFMDIEEPTADASSRRSLPSSSLTVGPCTGELVEIITTVAKELDSILRSAPLDRSTFRKHVLLKLTATVVPELLLAGLCLGLFLAAVEEPPRFELEACADMDSCSLLRVWAHWRELAKSAPPLAALEQHDDRFTWISVAGASYELERLAAAATSLRYGYALLKSRYDGPSKSAMVSGTQLIMENGDLVNRSTCKRKIPVDWSQGNEGALLKVVASLVNQGFNVAAVNASSAYQVAGGFLRGAAHSLEESLCMQSTLFFSLQKAARLAEKRNVTDAAGRRVHIPECGAVVSPCVQIFREGVDQGYAPSSPSELAAVVSVSVPSRNSSTTEYPIDHQTGDSYERLLRQKFHAVLWGGVRTGANSFVIPEMGLLPNDAAVIGRALGAILSHFEGHVEKVIIMGQQDFYEAVRAEYKGLADESIAAVDEHNAAAAVPELRTQAIALPTAVPELSMQAAFEASSGSAGECEKEAISESEMLEVLSAEETSSANENLEAIRPMSDFEIPEETQCEGVIGEVAHQFVPRLELSGPQARPCWRSADSTAIAKKAKPEEQEQSETRLDLRAQPSPGATLAPEVATEVGTKPSNETGAASLPAITSTATTDNASDNIASEIRPGKPDHLVKEDDHDHRCQQQHQDTSLSAPKPSSEAPQTRVHFMTVAQPQARHDYDGEDKPETMLDFATEVRPVSRMDLASGAQPQPEPAFDHAMGTQPQTRLNLLSEGQPLTRVDLASEVAQPQIEPEFASEGQPLTRVDLASEAARPQTRLDIATERQPLTQVDLACEPAQPQTRVDLAGDSQPQTRLDAGSEARPRTKLNLADVQQPQTRLDLLEDLHMPLTRPDLASDLVPGEKLPEHREQTAEAESCQANEASSVKAESAHKSWVLEAVQQVHKTVTNTAQTIAPSPTDPPLATVTSRRSWAAFTDNPERAESARQLGLELRAKALESRKRSARYVTMLSKYDPHKTGQFPTSTLQQVLSECRSRKRPQVEELQFLTHVSAAEMLRNQQQLSQEELCYFMQIWELYEIYREDLDLLFYLYDGDASGVLGPPEVAHVLQEISDGALCDGEVEAIMKKADFTPAGAITRMEFAMMVARWQAHSAKAGQHQISGPFDQSSEQWNNCVMQ